MAKPGSMQIQGCGPNPREGDNPGLADDRPDRRHRRVCRRARGVQGFPANMPPERAWRSSWSSTSIRIIRACWWSCWRRTPPCAYAGRRTAEGRANRVYIIPPDATLTIENGTLQVTTPAPPRENRRPIDTFFASLAKDQGERAVSIVLSGVGSDGTAGLRAIKEHGGLTLAQAEVDHMAMKGMPTSAAATGLVDHVVAGRGHAGEACRAPGAAERDQRLDRRRRPAPRTGRASEHDQRPAAQRIGHDFAGYKENTLIRRVQRRMQVLQIDTVTAYIEHLRDRPARSRSFVPRAAHRRHAVLPRSRGVRRAARDHLSRPPEGQGPR